jgi:hypothetical protein
MACTRLVAEDVWANVLGFFVESSDIYFNTCNAE